MAKTKDKPLIAYAPGFGPEDDIFGEGRKTNNPNSTPVGGGLDPNLRRILEQNMGTVRRNISGGLVDPLAPTGLDWLESNNGRGQVHSWDQPQYPNLSGNQALERQRAQDIFRAENEQTVYDQRGQSIRTPYGTGSNVPIGDVFGGGQTVPESGTGRMPNRESGMLTQSLNDIFNSQAATPRPAMTPNIPSNFDITNPQPIPPSTEMQNLPSFDPNQSLWQRFMRGEFDPQQGPPAPSVQPAPSPLGSVAPSGPPAARESGFSPQTQAAVNYFTNPSPQPSITDLLKQFILAQFPNRTGR